jgi:hypothetical protein
VGLVLAQAAPEEFLALGVGFFMVVVVPLVWMLLHHQRKMTQLLQGGSQQQKQQTDVQQLHAEVQRLTDKVNHLVLLIDDRRELEQRMAPPPVPDRARLD